MSRFSFQLFQIRAVETESRFKPKQSSSLEQERPLINLSPPLLYCCIVTTSHFIVAMSELLLRLARNLLLFIVDITMAKRGKAAMVRLIENIRKKGLHNGQKRAREAVPIRGLSLFLSAIKGKQDKRYSEPAASRTV